MAQHCKEVQDTQVAPKVEALKKMDHLTYIQARGPRPTRDVAVESWK